MFFGAEFATGTMFQHTAARRRLAKRQASRPRLLCFNTQPPEGGWKHVMTVLEDALKFQHTAARRRLGISWAGLIPTT